MTRVQYGMSSPATSEPVGIPILRMNNLQDDSWDLSDLKYIALSQEELERYRVNWGDILFNRTNSKELVGKCAVFQEAGDWVFASYLIRISLDRTQTMPDFVSNFLNTGGRKQIDRLSRQIIGMTNINAQEIRSLQIPLPPLDIQRQLVAVMEAARAARKAKLAEADALLAGMDAFVLEQLGMEMPVEEKRQAFGVRLEQLWRKRFDVKAHRIGTSPLRGKYPNGVIGTFVHRIQKRLLANEINREDFITLSLDGSIKPKRIMEWRQFSDDKQLFKAQMFEGKRGELIFSKIDFRNGAIAIINQDRVAVTAEFPIYEVDTTIVDPEYLITVLRLQIFRDWVNNLSAGHSGRKRVNPQQFESFVLPLPSLAIQQSIVAELNHRRAEARRLRAEADAAWAAAKARFEQALLGD